MIASPSDVIEQRDEIRRVVNNWNFVHSYNSRLILMPVGWETHAAPDLAGRAQSLINDRLLKDCDILVGVFWTRLGTPTGGFDSGTVEEIARHVDAGKPAMVYFSNAPVAPASLDAVQYERVQEFKKWCFERGLVAEFSNPEEFSRMFERQLQIQLNSNPYLKGILENAEVGDSVSTVAAELSSQAQKLLLAATDDQTGYIMILNTFGGKYIQTNGMTFGEPAKARSAAQWEAAAEELLNLGYIVPRGDKGEMFQVTNAGYACADAIREKDV
jgi:hypothetical protein